MRIFGDLVSGNCLKVKWTCDHLGLPYEWVDVDIMQGESRTPAFLKNNPFGQVPLVELDDGRHLAQSNAIILYLATNTALLPDDPFDRAKVMEWLFWEQYSHEPYVAVCRFQMKYLGKCRDQLDPDKVERGSKALETLDNALQGRDFLASESLSVADIALIAYSRVADEGGFELAPYANLRAWITRVETAIGIT
jgi:glutathione S-transferase